MHRARLLLPVSLMVVAACASPSIVVPRDGTEPDETSAYVAAFDALLSDEPMRAAALLEPLTRREPWWVPAHVLRQDALLAAGDRDGVRDWYRERADADPDDAMRVLLAARVGARDDVHPESDYRRALTLAPDLPWPAIALVHELVRRAQGDAARAIRLDDSGDRATADEARRAAERRFDEALSLSERVVRTQPGLADAHEAHAAARLAAGVLRGDRELLRHALAASTAAVELDPGHPRRHVLDARVRRELIDDVGAERALRAALALDPDDPGLLAGLGRVLLDLGRPADARDVLREAVRLAPRDAAAAADLGVACHRTGDAPAARSWLAVAVELAPDDDRIRASRALLAADADSDGAP